MKYQRKTRDEIEVQGYYGRTHGWECVAGAENSVEARQHIRDYRANEPGTPFRIKTVRVKIEAAS